MAISYSRTTVSVSYFRAAAQVPVVETMNCPHRLSTEGRAIETGFAWGHYSARRNRRPPLGVRRLDGYATASRHPAGRVPTECWLRAEPGAQDELVLCCFVAVTPELLRGEPLDDQLPGGADIHWELNPVLLAPDWECIKRKVQPILHGEAEER